MVYEIKFANDIEDCVIAQIKKHRYKREHVIKMTLKYKKKLEKIKKKIR